MINTTTFNNNTVLKDTIDMLFGLDHAKLLEVQSYIRGLTEEENDELFGDLYTPLSEAELLERIDHSLAHLNDGTAIEAEQCYHELLTEYGL